MKALTLTISQFNTFVKNILDAEEFLSNIAIIGEVTNLKISGNNAFFDLKDEKRERKLLAHKNEIRQLQQAIQQKGFTLVPLEVYSDKHNRYKVKIGIAQGKHNYDKRQTIKERDLKREAEKALKN